MPDGNNKHRPLLLWAALQCVVLDCGGSGLPLLAETEVPEMRAPQCKPDVRLADAGIRPWDKSTSWGSPWYDPICAAGSDTTPLT